jgi:hypothetical protein
LLEYSADVDKLNDELELRPRLSARLNLRPFLPFVDQGKSDHTLVPQELDTEGIDLSQTVRAWLDHCDENHQGHCLNHDASKPQSQKNHARWLIDAEENCLVPATPDKRYVALSYVWGSVPSSHTTLSNLELLGRKQSSSPAALSSLI